MKKTQLSIWYFACLAFIFLAFCSRDDEPKDEILTTVIEGHVLTRGTQDVVPDGPHMVTLSAADRNGNLDTTFTDGTGYFKLVYTASNEGVFNPVDFRPNFHGNYPEGYIENAYILGSSRRIDNLPAVFSGDHQVNNIFLYRKAWIRLHVLNINPEPWNIIAITRNQHTKYYHGAQDFEEVYMGLGNIENIVEYAVMQSDGSFTSQIIDLVQLGDNDTTYHRIEY
ncbi:MAG: hypothetical protein JJU02_06885 [Cryomorphaceae bacterium]|nr:hypothetical protein [Cryomorphaceae bacterium]